MGSTTLLSVAFVEQVKSDASVALQHRQDKFRRRHSNHNYSCTLKRYFY